MAEDDEIADQIRAEELLAAAEEEAETTRVFTKWANEEHQVDATTQKQAAGELAFQQKLHSKTSLVQCH